MEKQSILVIDQIKNRSNKYIVEFYASFIFISELNLSFHKIDNLAYFWIKNPSHVNTMKNVLGKNKKDRRKKLVISANRFYYHSHFLSIACSD